jgi:hypothetical protein
VLDLKIACIEHEVYLRPCHISGDRMIATGMDGWSRGDLMESGTFGFVRGKGKLQFTTHNVAQSGGDEVNQS